jgi:hypothetical protein
VDVQRWAVRDREREGEKDAGLREGQLRCRERASRRCGAAARKRETLAPRPEIRRAWPDVFAAADCCIRRRAGSGAAKHRRAAAVPLLPRPAPARPPAAAACDSARLDAARCCTRHVRPPPRSAAQPRPHRTHIVRGPLSVVAVALAVPQPAPPDGQRDVRRLHVRRRFDTAASTRGRRAAGLSVQGPEGAAAAPHQPAPERRSAVSAQRARCRAKAAPHKVRPKLKAARLL